MVLITQFGIQLDDLLSTEFHSNLDIECSPVWCFKAFVLVKMVSFGCCGMRRDLWFLWRKIMMIHLSMTQASDEFINQKALSSAALAFAQNLTHVVESTDENFSSKLRKIVNKFLR